MLHEYHVISRYIYSVRYYPLFHVTAVGLGTFTRGYGGPPAYTFITTKFQTAQYRWQDLNGSKADCLVPNLGISMQLYDYINK
jgi:hypothetical protein